MLLSVLAAENWETKRLAHLCRNLNFIMERRGAHFWLHFYTFTLVNPTVLQSMGSQRVRHDWATELNWTLYLLFLIPLKWQANQNAYWKITLVTHFKSIKSAVMENRQIQGRQWRTTESATHNTSCPCKHDLSSPWRPQDGFRVDRLVQNLHFSLNIH